MFQNYALFPWLKVGENIEYPMKKMKVPKEERKKKLKELLEMAQLTNMRTIIFMRFQEV